jgi:4-alpha-glucanotransferase
MKILQFAFGSDLPTNPYIPHNFSRNCIVYTGTHDNNTIQGWFKKEASEDDKKRLAEYLGHTINPEQVHWDMIRLAFSTVAETAVIPMQDYLGLGEESRMNFPQKTEGNWLWRVLPDQITARLAETLAHLNWFYSREPETRD